MRWFRFFLGSPARALATIAGITALAFLERFAPGTISAALTAVGSGVLMAVLGLLERFLGPIVQALLPFIIAGVGIRIMMKGFGGGKKK